MMDASVSQRRTAWGLLLLRFLVGWVFLSEGIQKFLFPAALGSGLFEKIGISDWAIQEPHDLTRPFAALLGAFACAWDLGAFLALDLEARRAPGTLPIRGSREITSSQARSAASSKSGASAGSTCQPVTSFLNT